MNRDGQVWLEYEVLYLVLGGPVESVAGHRKYRMLDLVSGEQCDWGEGPSWEDDETIERLA